MGIQQEIDDAVGVVAETLAQHPERRIDWAEQAVMRGEPRQYPVIYLGRLVDTDAGEGMDFTVPPVRSPEERVLDGMRGMLWSLRMHNPIRARIGLGKGTGTLPASFGLYLDPTIGYTPRGCRTLDEVLAAGMPDPETSGIIPEMREDIAAIKSLTPEWVEINLPDMQGIFNIAHAVLGDEAFFAPVEDPDKFAAFLTLVTDFYLAVHENLRRWIGPQRFPQFPGASIRIAECSVNLVSTETYLEHLLPHDLRIAQHFGQIGVHPCSGPHVFYATMRHLPKVVYQEAGFIAQTAAGAISVDDALAEIGDRPIILAIGQELPQGEEEAFIRHDLDRARTNPRLLFSYTGMHWKRRDEEMIREMHLRLDEYWQESVYSVVGVAG